MSKLDTTGRVLTGWNPEDSQEFLEHYLRVTRRARKVVDEVFWGEVISEHDDY